MVTNPLYRSDVLGHIMPMFGRDWSQAGVCELLTNIADSGYKILYLTARAIGQAGTTKKYLKSVKQNGFSLPEGPVFMSPDRLFGALKREVILKKPEVFKIGCLRALVNSFGEDCRKPIYGGFGNKSTDAVSYRAVGVDKTRIFIVNPEGELYQMNNTGYKWSYSKLNESLGHFFPDYSTRSQKL